MGASKKRGTILTTRKTSQRAPASSTDSSRPDANTMGDVREKEKEDRKREDEDLYACRRTSGVYQVFRLRSELKIHMAKTETE